MLFVHFFACPFFEGMWEFFKNYCFGVLFFFVSNSWSCHLLCFGSFAGMLASPFPPSRRPTATGAFTIPRSRGSVFSMRVSESMENCMLFCFAFQHILCCMEQALAKTSGGETCLQGPRAFPHCHWTMQALRTSLPVPETSCQLGSLCPL